MSSTEATEKLSIKDLYKEGDFIDAKDNQADWRVGYIVAKNENIQSFKVRFDGWSSKYDEYYKFNSIKLKPFRTLIVGYTGQKQNPALREGWTFSVEKTEEKIKQLQSFKESPSSLSVHQLNQFIRGYNYFFVDFLMTVKYPSPDTLGLVLRYFKLNMQMLVDYLKMIIDNFGDYMKHMSANKEMEDFTPTQAYYHSYYEIFDTVYIIFGNYQRLDGFFRNNQQHLREFFKETTNKDMKKVYKKIFSEHLVTLNGLDAINKLLSLIAKEQSVPFFFLSAFAHMLEGVLSLFLSNIREEIVTALLKIGDHNINKLKDSQIKELHRTDVSAFIQALMGLSKNTKYSDSIEEWATMLQLSLSLKMIMCPYFERKLKGISHIIEVCERHQVILSKNDQFRAWINKTKLFEVLFQMNDNLQIIKKSCELTKFMVLRNLLKPEDVDIIWNSRVGKHETIVKQIYNLIGQLPYYQKDVNQNLKLFAKVSNVPKNQWDEDYIHMIRQFSQNAYGFNTKEHMRETFGFDMISQFAISSEKEFAMNELVSLLNFFQNSDIFNKFQSNCFEEVQKGNKVKTYIKLLLSLHKENIETFIKLDLPLIKIVIDHLLKNKENPDKDMISDSFELLLAVTKTTTQEIQVQLFVELWHGFMKSVNKDIFIRWLYKKKENGRVFLSTCLTGNIKKYLLTHLWKKDEDFKKISEEEAVLIVELFKFSNESEQKLKKPHPMVMIIVSHQLIGYEMLLKTLKETQDDKAAELICDFLAEISNSYDQVFLEEAINNHSFNLISSIKEAISSHDINYLVRLLTLFKRIIDFDDELYPIKHQPRHNFPKEYSVVRKDLNEEITLKFSCTAIYYDFKRLLSSKIGLPLNKFYLVNSKGIRLTREHFYKTMIEPPMTGGKFHLLLKEEPSVIKNVFNKNLDIFFNLLDDPRIEKLVWNIVERLPISEQLKEKVTKTDDIFYELEHVGFYKKLYMLKVMLELDEEWWFKLARVKSISQFLAYFKQVSFKTQVEEDYVITLTRIINTMIKISQKHPEVVVPDQIFNHLVPVLVNLFAMVQKEGTKNLETEEQIIKNIFQIADHLATNQQVIKELVASQHTELLMNLILIKIPIQELRKRFMDEFKNILKFWHPEENWQIIALLLGKLLENVISSKNKDNLREYFTLTSFMLSKCHIGLLQGLYKKEIKGLVPRLFALIKHEQVEESNESTNKALEGYLTLLKHVICLEDQKIQNEIFSYLVNECLFSELDPKCKSSPSRRESFNVLLELSENQKNVQAILPYLTEMHKKGHWRSKRLEDWGITINDKSKSSTGYVGLKNLGCICYMNSFNQQLFMIPYFRYSITNADDSTTGQVQPQENVLYQVQKMFMNLQYSDKKYYNPKPFCHAFKDYQGNPTNVVEQMDIDEYSNVLFDRLEFQLKNTQYSSLIKDMFGGVFSNQIVCKGCPHYSESEQPFLSISLTVKSKKNIYQSFQTMIKGDTLDGDNAYFCERCNKKVSAVKRMSLKKLPNHLIVTLKRFEFDYQKMMKLKVNDYCEFPLNLNLQEYSQQYLRKKEKSNAEDEEEEYSNDYFNYILKGFVVHVGSADSGHYYSFIQDRLSNKWFEFNDTVVREFDIADLAEEAFGGETGGYDTREKIKNAYMVIYERQKKITIGNQIPIKREAIKRKQVNQKILTEIMKQNKEQKLQNILFSREYTRYLLGMLTKSDKLDLGVQRKILKYAIIFYLTITIRQKNEGLNEFMLKRISKVIDKHPDLAEWTLDLFSNQKIYDEFFLHNLFRETRKVLAFWLVRLHKLCRPQVKINFINSLITKMSSKSENYIDACLIIYEIAVNDKEMLTYLLKVNILGRLIVNISREKDKFKELLEVHPTESEIGYEEQVEKTPSEELKNKKLRLQESENEYVWGLMTLMIEHAKSHQTTLKEIIPEEEFECLEVSQTKIYKILEELKTKFGIYSFTKFISYLTVNNEQFLRTMLNFVYTGLKEFQSKRYRQFMLFAEELMSIRDDFFSLRLQALNKIIEALKFNEQYSSDSNIIQQWIIILLNRNSHLRDYLSSEPDLLDYLYTLTSKKVPSDEISKKNKKFNQSMVNKLHGVKFLCAKKGYLKLAQQIRIFYKMIMDNNFEFSEYWPWRSDNYMKELHVGDKVSYFDINDTLEYEEATVQSMSLGKIELAQGKNKSFTVWKDDQKLMAEVPIELDIQYSEGSSSKLTDQLEDEDTDFINDI